MLNNFLYRVGQWLRENEQRVIKWALIMAAAILILFLLFTFIESAQRSKYENKIQKLEKQFQEANQKAKDAQARADAKQKEIDAKQAELQFLEARAIAAEDKLHNAKTKVITLKEAYETIRYTPMPDTPISLDDVCRQLAGLGYECR